MLKKNKQPKTKAALAKFRYAVSPRSPQGQAYDPAQCGWIVYECRRPDINWQCSKKSGYGRQGLWCCNHATTV